MGRWWLLSFILRGPSEENRDTSQQIIVGKWNEGEIEQRGFQVGSEHGVYLQKLQL